MYITMGLYLCSYITGSIGRRKLEFNLMGIKEMIQEGLVSITPKQRSECLDHVK